MNFLNNHLSDIEYRVDRILRRWEYAQAANVDSDRDYYLRSCQQQTQYLRESQKAKNLLGRKSELA